MELHAVAIFPHRSLFGQFNRKRSTVSSAALHWAHFVESVTYACVPHLYVVCTCYAGPRSESNERDHCYPSSNPHASRVRLLLPHFPVGLPFKLPERFSFTFTGIHERQAQRRWSGVSDYKRFAYKRRFKSARKKRALVANNAISFDVNWDIYSVRENLRTIGLTLFSASELRTWPNVCNKPCNLRNNVAYVRTEQACDGIRACLASFSAEVNFSNQFPM